MAEKFEPPTEKDVAMYMASHHYVKTSEAVVEAKKFMGYQEAHGWIVGKQKAKSWKGLVATWVGNLPPHKFTHQRSEEIRKKDEQLRRELNKLRGGMS
jgi:hypothetical protein